MLSRTLSRAPRPARAAFASAAASRSVTRLARPSEVQPLARSRIAPTTNSFWDRAAPRAASPGVTASEPQNAANKNAQTARRAQAATGHAVRWGATPPTRCGSLRVVNGAASRRHDRAAEPPHAPAPLFSKAPNPLEVKDMGDRKQRVKGKANEVAGKAKGRAGYETGSGKTEAKGAAQTVKGKAQQTAGKARSRAKKATS